MPLRKIFQTPISIEPNVTSHKSFQRELSLVAIVTFMLLFLVPVPAFSDVDPIQTELSKVMPELPLPPNRPLLTTARRQIGADWTIANGYTGKGVSVVVMDWVDGPNLTEAVQKKVLKNWTMILTLARDLARIIHAAHLLPERVLHRDIRPPNVMLRDFWTNGNELNVVVMDFDLSWHVDALEKSIVAKPLGFMAPEQLHQRESASTRSATRSSCTTPPAATIRVT